MLGVILLAAVGCSGEADVQQVQQSDSGEVSSKLLEPEVTPSEVTPRESTEAGPVATLPCSNYGISPES